MKAPESERQRLADRILELQAEAATSSPTAHGRSRASHDGSDGVRCAAKQAVSPYHGSSWTAQVVRTTSPRGPASRRRWGQSTSGGLR